MTGQNAQADTNRILDIQTLKSDGDLNYMLVSDTSLPIITMNFSFKGAGSINDPDGLSGLGQLTSNTMDEGAGDRDGQAFQEALQDRAIELSFNNGRDHFGGKIKFLKRHKDIATELLADAINRPRFDGEAVERMKNANIMRIKASQSNTDWQSSRLTNDVYFGDHPYAGNSGGTISGLQSVTADDMRAFMKGYLTRSNLNIAIAGDINAAEAGQLIDAVFGDLPETGATNDNQFDAVQTGGDVVVKGFASQSPQSSVQMVWPTFPKSNNEYYALRVLNQILGAGGFSSMLMDEIREKRGLTYGIYSRLTHMDYADYLSIESATSPENIAPMMDAIQGVLETLKTTLVDNEMLNEAKSYMVGSMPLKFSSTQSLSATPLALKMDGLSMDYLDRWADKINAVTADDVKNVANMIFENSKPNVTVIAGAIPDGMDIELVDTLPGVE